MDRKKGSKKVVVTGTALRSVSYLLKKGVGPCGNVFEMVFCLLLIELVQVVNVLGLFL